MSWYVYMVRCADDSLYTGVTNDLASRIDQHNLGKGARYTRTRRPVELVYQEPAADRGAALRRELAIKRLCRADKIALTDTKTA
jgi:putative endonuclease